ncbi:amidase [Alicyclobacillus shizuokensis]|uniref:amidase n=1 Tax=Alicyclobacillus shizuokensis TaxID=392014 RepID=UPI00082E9E21|nr:amidase [Alicyclobacillus shizuokensis]MCL6625008.1 aspartyl/glutamyl-tRNA amidotransferase subunit A [Alicyclobacillus shizuokensis]
MTSTQTLAFATISETAPRIQSREVSPVEVTEQMLERIEAINPKLNAFVTMTPELAMEQARRAEGEILKGNYRGPLHGIPIVHKDLYYTKGIRTTASSKILEDFIPDYDATVVEKLADAGSILLGKVQTHEFAAGGTTDSPHFGPCHNPWDVDRVPGGSSGGTAACVAAGLAFAGTGSDTGGSVRIPASCCGVVGMKPTYGRVSRYGIFPLAWSLDHAGPLARSVLDAALCLQVMAGYDPKDDSTVDLPVPNYAEELQQSIRGKTVGIPSEYYFDGLDSEVAVAVESAIEVFRDLGADVTEVHIPMIRYAPGAEWAICLSESAAIHDAWIQSRPDDYSDDVRLMIEAGKFIPATRYLQAQRVRHLIRDDFMAALAKADVLITPTLPFVAPRIGNKDTSLSIARFTFPTDVTGLPSLSLPCGFSSDGLPIGLQVIGAPFDESAVLRFGYAYEQATDWHHHHPTL